MPYKCPEKRKAVKRMNYAKNATRIKARMAWNRKKKKILEWKRPVFSDEQIAYQIEFIKKSKDMF